VGFCESDTFRHVATHHAGEGWDEESGLLLDQLALLLVLLHREVVSKKLSRLPFYCLASCIF